MKNAIVIFFISLVTFKAFAQINTQSILKHSKSYYFSLRDFSVDVETKFKNAIIIDTIIRNETFHIKASWDIKFFKNKELVFAVINGEEYNVYLKTNSFDRVKSKRQSIYKREYSQFPFTETNNFFFKMNLLLLKHPKLLETDSTYLLFASGKTVEFRKSDYSIKRIKEVIYDKLNDGYQSKELFFSAIRELGINEEKEIGSLLQIINDDNRIMNYVKEDIPQFINRDTLSKKLAYFVNTNGTDIKNKTVFLNFFYQGCYPCVKSYPYVNKLYGDKDKDVVVIGVDQLFADTATIDKYIEKYDLQYPIVVGENAVFLTNFFKLNSFPVFIVVAPEGKVVQYEYGFIKASFKRLVRQMNEANVK